MAKIVSFRDGMANLKAQLQAEAEKKGSGGGNIDERQWNPVIPKGQSEVEYVIRFLPMPNQLVDERPWVKKFVHYVQRPGAPESAKKFFATCPGTIGQRCPICEDCAKLYNTGNPHDEQIAQKRYKKADFFANVLVVKDPVRPECEGKVFMYRFGKKIWEKLDIALREDTVLFYEPAAGREFKLVIKKVQDFNNYDTSRFAASDTPLAATEDKMVEILDKAYDLKKIVLGAKFDSYDQVSDKYYTFLSGDATSPRPATSVKTAQSQEEEAVGAKIDELMRAGKSQPQAPSAPANETVKTPEAVPEEEGDDAFDFAKLEAEIQKLKLD
jgi:hypothetical protein